ncbi:tetratricopeptide repeat-containing glycosyltransferase family protein [Paraburkholderia agricolaris]|jgi:tetratricopeptide (TPR) repeat protein|nr:tetratricopeptide repeat-containing glycosyltransferase family protein [Paraburkholderia agricolaris]
MYFCFYRNAKSGFIDVLYANISSIDLSPMCSDVIDFASYADAYFAERKLTMAIVEYGRILDRQPQNLHALHCMGLACVLDNQIERARGILARAALVAPERSDILEQCGLLAALTNDDIEAEAYYRRALDFGSGTASLHRNLADVLRKSGRTAEAEEQYKQSVAIQPDLHHAIRALARISSELGEIEDAATYWLRAWEIDPADLQDGLDLIIALGNAGRAALIDEVVFQIRRRFAADVDALDALCLALHKSDCFDKMLSVARQGIGSHLKCGALHHYAAHALSMCGDNREAIAHSRAAVQLLPDDPIMQYQLGCLELSIGEFENGWARRNTYYSTPLARRTRVHPNFRLWLGEPVAGRSFLLVGEQGRGDEIQFMRFAEWLKQRGGIVDVLVSKPIVEIARSMTGVRKVLTQVPAGPYDYWCHMMRIPEHLKVNLSTLPGPVPYIFALPEKVGHWRDRINVISSGERCNQRRVGIVWSGGPYHVHDRFRSVGLAGMEPLFSVPGVSWFSVQKGESEQESESLSDNFNIHTLGPEIENFTDTLAILHSLDLLITVDTSVAHLAGAAGLPVWTLVPAYTEWRWLTDRTDSPWYPSMRLFRQRELGDWTAVIEDVRNALCEWSRATCSHN